MTEPDPAVSLREATRAFAHIGLHSFGGPAGQIAVMHRVLVEEKRWISEERFLHALNFCMLLPGPEAQQLATYCGWLLHGWRGGVIAGTLFVLPGFLAILALSVLYVELNQVQLVTALFFGLKAATLALVIDAVRRVGRRALAGPGAVAIAIAAFFALGFGEVPFPIVVAGAALLGVRFTRDDSAHIAADTRTRSGIVRQSLGTALLWLAIWIAPMAALALALGRGHILVQVGAYFSQVAVVTFGGAYAVLAYVAQQAVEVHGWLRPGEMLDGLGMAETTPGPLIQVVQFVGFMGAYRDPAPFSPLAAGIAAACITTWVTFAPCFLWIFVGAPFVERLRGNRTIASALRGVTAAVVGVIANLALWFAAHVLFRDVGELRVLGLRIIRPDPSTVDLGAVAIATGALIALLRLGWGVPKTLGLATVVGTGWVLSR